MSDSPRFSRRRFNAALAAGGLAAFAPAAMRPPFAATDVYWMGWQGYDECFHATDYLEANGITFNTTYINSNEEVLTKLQAGGLGKYDVTTMYFGYLHLMAQSGLIEPIDEGKVQVAGPMTIFCPSFAGSMPWCGTASCGECRGPGAPCP